MTEKELYEQILEETYESTKKFLEVHISMLEGQKLQLIREGKEERALGVQDAIDILRDTIERGKLCAEQMKQEVNDGDLGVLSMIPEFNKGN